jgi:integrase
LLPNCFPEKGMAVKLIDRNLSKIALPAGKAEAIFWDDALPGFGLRLRVGGKRTWVAQYRLGEKQRRLTLGTPGSLSSEDARKAAQVVFAKVALGNDPASDKAEAKAKAPMTLNVASTQYLDAVKHGLAPRYYEEVERHLTKHWKPLGEMQIDRIARADVAAQMRKIAANSGPFAANRARAALSAFYSWALGEGVAASNPVVGVNKATAEVSRDRVLSDDEMAAIWNACGDDDYGRIVRLLALTGQRREEVAAIADSEINGALWTIPGPRAKNGREHEVPLSGLALDIIQSVPRREERDMLFGAGDGPFSGWSRAKTALDARLGKKLTPWRLHDLRRTAATGMAHLGVQPHVVEAVLNHISGHKAGVAGVYNRATYRAEKAAALALWAEHVQRIASAAEAL